jgi:hypothetical protein
MLFFLCGVLIGMSKAGITGLISVIIVIAANIFGGKNSSGIVLPLLLTANTISIIHYRNDFRFSDLFRILPWALAGLALGIVFGKAVSNETFTLIIGIALLGSVPILIMKEVRGSEKLILNNPIITAFIGIVAGFTSMVGNAAGPIMGIYLLSMQLKKNSYIVTTAWFFFIMSLIKVPIHIFIWETINLNVLLMDAIIIPSVFLGTFLGFKVIKIFPEKIYRIFIISVITFSSITLII